MNWVPRSRDLGGSGAEIARDRAISKLRSVASLLFEMLRSVLRSQNCDLRSVNCDPDRAICDCDLCAICETLSSSPDWPATNTRHADSDQTCQHGPNSLRPDRPAQIRHSSSHCTATASDQTFQLRPGSFRPARLRFDSFDLPVHVGKHKILQPSVGYLTG